MNTSIRKIHGEPLPHQLQPFKKIGKGGNDRLFFRKNQVFQKKASFDIVFDLAERIQAGLSLTYAQSLIAFFLIEIS